MSQLRSHSLALRPSSHTYTAALPASQPFSRAHIQLTSPTVQVKAFELQEKVISPLILLQIQFPSSKPSLATLQSCFFLWPIPLLIKSILKKGMIKQRAHDRIVTKGTAAWSELAGLSGHRSSQGKHLLLPSVPHNHRMVWIGRDFTDQLVPLPATRSACSKPCPAWP